MSTVTNISRTEPSEVMEKYLKEILSRAQGLGKDAGFVLPEYGVADRSALQQQASGLAASGLGAYAPMLQAGANTLGSGISSMYGNVQQGFNRLQGTGGRFDPSTVSEFMNPYEDAAVQQAMKDIRQQGNEPFVRVS